MAEKEVRHIKRAGCTVLSFSELTSDLSRTGHELDADNDAFFFSDRFVERVNGGLEHLVIGAASARMPEGNGDRVFGRVCQGGAGGADEHDQRQGKGDELFHGGTS